MPQADPGHENDRSSAQPHRLPVPRARGRRRRDPDRRPGAGGVGVRRGRPQEPHPRAHGHESRGDGPRLPAGRRVPVGTGVGGRDAPATRRRDRVRGRRAADRPGAGGGLPGRLGRGARSAAVPRGAGAGGRAGRPAQPDVAEHGRGVRARRAGIDAARRADPSPRPPARPVPRPGGGPDRAAGPDRLCLQRHLPDGRQAVHPDGAEHRDRVRDPERRHPLRAPRSRGDGRRQQHRRRRGHGASAAARGDPDPRGRGLGELARPAAGDPRIR